MVNISEGGQHTELMSESSSMHSQWTRSIPSNLAGPELGRVEGEVSLVEALTRQHGYRCALMADLHI